MCTFRSFGSYLYVFPCFRFVLVSLCSFFIMSVSGLSDRISLAYSLIFLFSYIVVGSRHKRRHNEVSTLIILSMRGLVSRPSHVVPACSVIVEVCAHVLLTVLHISLGPSFDFFALASASVLSSPRRLTLVLYARALRSA